MTLTELDDVSEAIRRALTTDFTALPGSTAEAAAEQIQAVKAQLTALEAEVVGAYDASLEWSRDGHRSAGAALRHRSRLRGADARSSVRLARALRSMPPTALALADGSITPAHAHRLARAATRPEFTDAEQFLLAKAAVLSFAQWEKAVTYWEHLVDEARAGSDPDRADPRETNRALYLSKTFAGVGRLDGWLDPVGYSDLAETLQRIEDEMFSDDWRLARDRLGDQVTAGSLWRTPAQRRADALVEMARRASSTPAGATAPRPLTIVHVDHHTFEAAIASLASGAPFAIPPNDRLCELDDGTVITPTQMVEQAAIGDVRRLVYGAPGVILDYGRRVRLFEGALREAVQARDRECRHPGCEIPARRCEIDHVVEWHEGGPTVHSNAEARCSFHHRRHKHRSG